MEYIVGFYSHNASAKLLKRSLNKRNKSILVFSLNKIAGFYLHNVSTMTTGTLLKRCVNNQAFVFHIKCLLWFLDWILTNEFLLLYFPVFVFLTSTATLRKLLIATYYLDYTNGDHAFIATYPIYENMNIWYKSDENDTVG